jgi:hypothetical protein
VEFSVADKKGNWWSREKDQSIVRWDDAQKAWVKWSEGMPDKPPLALMLDFSPQNKKRIVRSFAASAGEKYSRPFTQGQVALVSFLGTDSWTDYGQIVLQLMLVDSLATLEQQLGELNKRLGQSSTET